MEGFVDLSALLSAGVYALGFGDEVVYIGQSSSMLRRIYQHRNLYDRKRKGEKLSLSGPFSAIKAIRFNRVWVQPCCLSDLDRVERDLIRKLTPKHNRQHTGKNGKATFADLGIHPNVLIRELTDPLRIERRI